jgi:hypothetical protein
MRGTFIRKEQGDKPPDEGLAPFKPKPANTAELPAAHPLPRAVFRKPKTAKAPSPVPAPPSAEERGENRRNLIQWPADRQILEIVRQLKQVREVGARYEALGDYFNSGDLAYQLHEILRTVSDLHQKSRRISKRTGG